jgi:hypothetical protein
MAYRGGTCPTHGNSVAERRERGASGPWQCVQCAHEASKASEASKAVLTADQAAREAVASATQPCTCSAEAWCGCKANSIRAFYAAGRAKEMAAASDLVKLCNDHDPATCESHACNSSSAPPGAAAASSPPPEDTPAAALGADASRSRGSSPGGDPDGDGGGVFKRGDRVRGTRGDVKGLLATCVGTQMCETVDLVFDRDINTDEPPCITTAHVAALEHATEATDRVLTFRVPSSAREVRIVIGGED